MLENTNLFRPIILVIALICFSLSIFAQTSGGSIEGTVSGANGAPIAGAVIMIESAADTAGYKRTTETDKKGYFAVFRLQPGEYRINVSAKGFANFSQKFEVAGDGAISLRIELSVNKQDPGSAASTSSAATRRIPSPELPAKPNYGSLLKIAPTTRPEILAGGFQIDGASGSENTFFIDGQEVTNFKTGLLSANYDLPFESLKEVRIQTAGLPAENSGAFGGVVSAATNAGNDELHGKFGISFAPEKLQGRPNRILNRYGSAAGQIEYFQPNKDSGSGFFPSASLSGPVVKNKFWFSASYSPQIYDLRRSIDYFSTGANPSGRAIRESIGYEARSKADAAYLRLDSQPYSNLRLFAIFLYNPITQDGILPFNGEGLAGSPQSAGNLRGAEYLANRGGRQNSNIINGQLTWDISKKILLNFRAGRGFLNEKLDTYGLPRATRYICSGNPPPGANCLNGFQNFSSNFARDFEASKRTTFEADSSFNAINAFGRHNFKFGYQFNHLFNEIREGYTETGIIQLLYGLSIDSLVPVVPTPGNLGSGFLQRFGAIGDSSNANHALYAQDSWSIKNRLLLEIGIRFENENIPDYRKNLGIRFGWGEKIAPRLGFALDIFGNGKTKASGNYGWYYDRLKYNAFQAQFPQIFFRDYFEILPGRGAAFTNYTLPRILGSNSDNPGGNCPIVGSSGWSVCQVSFTPLIISPALPIRLPLIAPDLKAPRSSQYSFGVKQRLAGNFSIEGRYIHRGLDRAIEDIAVFDDQGGRFFTIENPGFGRVCEIAAGSNLPCPKAERRYDAFEAIIDKWAPNYFFNASYTYSRLFGNYSGLASSDEFGRVAPNNSRYFDSPSQGADADGNPDNGRLATDRPHAFKAYGGYSFNWLGDGENRTSISAFTTIQSGTPLTTIYSLYGVSTSILFGRGDLGRSRSFSETDLMLSHRYSFGRDQKFSFEPYLVFINLFDQRNEMGRQTSISATNFTNTALSSNGCSACINEAAVYQVIHNGSGVGQYIRNFLNSRGVSAAGIRNDYNRPNIFQAPRYFRFGARFKF